MRKLLTLLVIVICLANCGKRYIAYDDPVPAHDSLLIASVLVKEDRVINVWTPPTYAQGSERFPVLYMPDGGIREDFPHIANTLAALIEAKKVPPFILVGIENTERGRDLTGSSEVADDEKYCPITDGAKDFRAFIAEELMPEIESRYRTQNRKGIIGESLAGLFVMETFLTQPHTFDFYIAMDPSLWWNDHYLVRQADALLAALPESPMKLWFAGSSAEDISEYTRALAKTMEDKSPSNLRWTYSDEPDEAHHTIFRSTKEKALIWALNDTGE